MKGVKMRKSSKPEFPRRRSLIGAYRTVAAETAVVMRICAANIPYTLRMNPHRS